MSSSSVDRRCTAADHQAIVALGVGIVQMHAEQPAAAMDQMGRESRLLAGVKRMGEIHGDAEVR